MNDGALVIPVIYDFVFNILILLYRLLGENLGLALISVAVLSRLITLPLTAKQIKNASKTKEFQTKYKEVKEKYKDNKEKQSQELARLQGQYLPGQLAGCLPLILQLVVLIQINFVVRNLIKHGSDAFNEIAYGFVGKFEGGYEFNLHFFGDAINLGKSANDVGVTNLSNSWPYIAIAVVLVISQFFSMRIFSSFGKGKEEKKDKPKKKKDESPSFGEIFSQTNGQMMMFFPVILGFFSLNYPSGLSLYFATTSLFVIIQQSVMRRKEIVSKFRKKYFVDDDKKDKEVEKIEVEDKVEDKEASENIRRDEKIREYEQQQQVEELKHKKRKKKKKRKRKKKRR